MKKSCFTWAVLVIACLLIFYVGFEQQANASPEPNVSKSESAKSSPAAEPNIPKSESLKSIAGPNDLQPLLKIDNDTHNFGEVATRSVNNCQFKFSNTGKGTLIVKNVKATCGCTVPELKKREYAPGESGTIEVRFTAAAVEGDVVKHLYIHSNDSKKPEAELTLKAKVVAKIKYEPDTIKLVFNKENAGCPPIKVRSTDGKAFSIKSFKATANCLTVDFDPNASATEFTLQPKVNMDTLRKVLNGTVEIALTHPQCSDISIYFEATAAFSLNPPMIMILKAQPQTPVTREVWVLNNYKEPFEIESVVSQKGITKLASKEKSDNGCKLTLQITPPASEGKIKIFSDTVVVSIKGGEKLEINCRGFYEKDLTKAKQ